MSDVLQGKEAMLGHPSQCKPLARTHRTTCVHHPRLHLWLRAYDDALHDSVLPQLPLFDVIHVVVVVPSLANINIVAVVHTRGGTATVVVVGRLGVVVVARDHELPARSR